MKQTITESQLRRIILKEIESMVETETAAAPTAAPVVAPVVALEAILKTLVKDEDVNLPKLSSALRDFRTNREGIDLQEKQALGDAFLQILDTKDTNIISKIAALMKKIKK